MEQPAVPQLPFVDCPRTRVLLSFWRDALRENIQVDVGGVFLYELHIVGNHVDEPRYG